MVRYITILLILICSVSYGQWDAMLTASQVQFSNECAEVAGDVFPTGNVSSNCPNEANALGGWFVQNNSIIAAVASDESGYDYALSIKTDNLANGFSRAAINVPVANSTTYEVNIVYKVPVADTGSNTAPRVDFWSGVVTSPTDLFNTDGLVHTLTFNVTTNSTSVGTRFYNAYVGPVDSANVELIIYNVTFAPI